MSRRYYRPPGAQDSRPLPLRDNLGPITSARDLRGRHLLLIPSTVTAQEVAELVLARVPHSRLVPDGEVALGRLSRIAGPYELSVEEAVDAHVPMPWTVVYALTAPAEREDPPLPGADDRDGFARSFPQGLPWREEGRALQLMVSLARRLHGAVRVVGGAMITPDPQRAVDIVIHSPYWLEPETLLTIVRRVAPTARLAVQGRPWNGPSDAAYSGASIAELTADRPLSEEQLARLHHAADALDMARLAEGDVIDAFAIEAELGPDGGDGGDGAVDLLVHIGNEREPAVAGQPWTDGPFVSYEVRWSCPDWEERESRVPSPGYLDSRERVKPLVRAVARVVVEATGGIVTDEDGFWLDRYEL